MSITVFVDSIVCVYIVIDGYSMKDVGRLLKQYREEQTDGNGHYLSQLDLAYSIGWENPSTLSRIESGKVTPTRETILRIGKHLHLKKHHLDHALHLANYKGVSNVEYSKLLEDD